MKKKEKTSRENGYYGPSEGDLSTGGMIAVSILVGFVAGIVWFSAFTNPAVHSISGAVMAICFITLVLSIADNLWQRRK